MSWKSQRVAEGKQEGKPEEKPPPRALLLRIVERELKKLEKQSESDLFLDEKQVRTLEALARITRELGEDPAMEADMGGSLADALKAIGG